MTTGATQSPIAAMAGKVALVTGGTDGIGAATAMRLRDLGAEVIILGRSAAKADHLVTQAGRQSGPGSIRAIIADLSLMRTVRETVRTLATQVDHFDVLVQSVGILIARTAHTPEGVELDFAVGYLGRFVLLETASRLGLLTPLTRLVNIAASSPAVPRYARMEFTSLAMVEGRTGMKSHGQAQLANDLLTAQAGNRYGITAIGYGPGAVDTNIRREIPAIVSTVMKPFFARRLRVAEDVAEQLVAILADPALRSNETHFANADGYFPIADYIASTTRQAQLLEVSLQLMSKALDLTPGS